MFKKIFTTFVLTLSLVQIAYPLVLNAQAEYTVLAPLPGTTKGSDNKTDIKTYVEGMFRLLIALSAVFAVFMIVIGGFQYMTTDAIGGKQQGRERIENSIKGLVLVIGAWLILAQIDDRLLKINIDITAANVPAPSGGFSGGTGTLSQPGVPMTQVQIDTSNAIRGSLESQGVITYQGPCTQGQTTSCVNLNGLGTSALNGVVSLKNLVGSEITITGGTESGHSATGGHPTGSSLDFGMSRNSALTQYVTANGGTPTQTSLGPLYTININGKPVKFLKESDHWHVTF